MVNNSKNLNALQFLNSYALKLYEVQKIIYVPKFWRKSLKNGVKVKQEMANEWANIEKTKLSLFEIVKPESFVKFEETIREAAAKSAEAKSIKRELELKERLLARVFIQKVFFKKNYFKIYKCFKQPIFILYKNRLFKKLLLTETPFFRFSVFLYRIAARG